jgi:uncharacterized protein (TIGR02246 family)
VLDVATHPAQYCPSNSKELCMKMRAASLVAALVVVGMCVGLTAQKVDPAVEKLAEQYQVAFNKGDAKALAALYTADALRIPVDGTLLTGRSAIEASYVKNLAGPFKGTTLKLMPGKTQSLTSDVALIQGTYEVTGGSAPVRGRYLNTAVRQEGQWRLASVVTVPEAAAPK